MYTIVSWPLTCMQQQLHHMHLASCHLSNLRGSSKHAHQYIWPAGAATSVTPATAGTTAAAKPFSSLDPLPSQLLSQEYPAGSANLLSALSQRVREQQGALHAAHEQLREAQLANEGLRAANAELGQLQQASVVTLVPYRCRTLQVQVSVRHRAVMSSCKVQRLSAPS